MRARVQFLDVRLGNVLNVVRELDLSEKGQNKRDREVGGGGG